MKVDGLLPPDSKASVNDNQIITGVRRQFAICVRGAWFSQVCRGIMPAGKYKLISKIGKNKTRFRYSSMSIFLFFDYDQCSVDERSHQGTYKNAPR